MAVAIGAGCDFLTPIGHQCNTLVMGPGGYRFGDYPRLGLPLSLLVIVVAVPLLLLVWPLRSRHQSRWRLPPPRPRGRPGAALRLLPGGRPPGETGLETAGPPSTSLAPRSGRGRRPRWRCAFCWPCPPPVPMPERAEIAGAAERLAAALPAAGGSAPAAADLRAAAARLRARAAAGPGRPRPPHAAHRDPRCGRDPGQGAVYDADRRRFAGIVRAEALRLARLVETIAGR